MNYEGGGCVSDFYSKSKPFSFPLDLLVSSNKAMGDDLSNWATVTLKKRAAVKQKPDRLHCKTGFTQPQE